MYDVVIVGSGPAGAACAMTAARAGLDVLVVEKEEHPRRKLCGGAVRPGTGRLLGLDLGPVVERRVNTAVIVSPSGRTVVCTREDLTGMLVCRDRFDAYLVQQAEKSGATVVQGAAIVSAATTADRAQVSNGEESFGGRVLVGADGVNSTVARRLGLRRRWQADSVALCIAADVPLPASEVERITGIMSGTGDPAIEMYLDTMDWGFGWCFPKEHEVSIGVGCRMDHAGQLRGAWRSFAARLQQEKDVTLDLSGVSAARVPFGGQPDTLMGRRTLLVGDAAGLASPISGEGIYYAVRSGVVAARTVIDAVREDSKEHIRTYGTRLRRSVGYELGVARSIAGVLFRSRDNTERVCRIAQQDPVMKDLIVDFMAGLGPVAQLRREMLKKLVVRHPLEAMMLGLG